MRSFTDVHTYMGVADNIKQFDDVCAACEVLKNLDFSLDLLLLYGLSMR